MRTSAVIALVLLVLLLVPFVLTALGARRRGNSLLSAAVAGLFFPVTWTVWYLRDEHPYRR